MNLVCGPHILHPQTATDRIQPTSFTRSTAHSYEDIGLPVISWQNPPHPGCGRWSRQPLELQLVAKGHQVGWSHSPQGTPDSNLRRYTARPRGSA